MDVAAERIAPADGRTVVAPTVVSDARVTLCCGGELAERVLQTIPSIKTSRD